MIYKLEIRNKIIGKVISFRDLQPCKKKIFKNGKAIPVTDPGGPQGYETSSHPLFLDNRLTDGGYPPLPPRKNKTNSI
jgi:hypothetical protein